MFNKLKKALERRFIKSSEMSRILGLAFQSQKNCIIFGPGGHGKSEMIQTVVDSLGLGEKTFFQFFGEGMDESRLFGGLNFRKLEEEKILEYKPDSSFLNFEIAVFEELFDAPASVLLALKDCLTAKELRNGNQRFQMRTKVVICLTNKEPSEISSLGPAAHALVERFPLQLNLKWDRYDPSDYLELFQKVSDRLAGPVLNGFSKVLAEILSKSTAEGNFVSPRTAVHAYQLVQASCSMRNGKKIEERDLIDLRFLPGLEGLAQTIEQDLQAAMERAAAEERLNAAFQKFNHICNLDKGSPIKLLQACKSMISLQDEVSGLKVTDNLSGKRRDLRDGISEKISEFQRRALDATKI